MEPVRTATRQSDEGASSKQQTKKTDIRRKSQVKVTRQMTSEESKKITRQFTRQESVITVTSTTTKIINGKVVAQETDVKKSVDTNVKQSNDASVRKSVEAATNISAKQSRTTAKESNTSGVNKAKKSASVGKKVNRTPASS